MKGIAARSCLAVCELFESSPLRYFNGRRNAPGDRYASKENYVADRTSNINDYYDLFRNITTFRGRTVLELGCSSGYLLDSFLKQESFTGIGADIDPAALSRAQTTFGDRAQWVQTTAKAIPVPTDSVDVAYTIDTVEHLSQPRDIFLEVHRILKPGGVFLIYFAPWFAPCGAHLDDIIPFPWPHVFFSMDTLLDVAAHIYDSPEHVPACYWIDDATGRRRPNPYLDRERWREFLNDLTIRKFKRLLRTLPFQVERFQKIGFGGKSYRFCKAFSCLAQIPIVNEFAIKAVFCVIRKPATT